MLPARSFPRIAPLLAAAAGLALLSLAAAPATATPATLKRSIQNLTQFPLDVALSPVVAANSIQRNLRTVDDSLAVKIAYPLPGFVWNTMVQAGAGMLRGVTGVLELAPGVILLPFETDMAPLFDPSEENAALVDYETPVYHVKFGVDYTTPE